jgi:cytoskeletal protein RodZ
MQNAKTGIFKSKLALSAIAIALLIVVLSAWGLINNSQSQKEVDQAYLALQQKNAQDELKSSDSAAQQVTTVPSTSSTTPSSPAGSNSKSKSTKSTSTNQTPSAQASAGPTEEAKTEANYNMQAISSCLEAYYTVNVYYPSDIAYSNFSDMCSSSSPFTPPAGIHYSYVPTPAGCSTAAHNCQHFTLDALDSNNKAVAPQQKSIY